MLSSGLRFGTDHDSRNSRFDLVCSNETGAGGRRSHVGPTKNRVRVVEMFTSVTAVPGALRSAFAINSRTPLLC